jgi:hypothetical protein
MLGSEGYGIVTIKKIRYYVHRIAWQRWNDHDIPKDFVIAHYCHNRACVNPMHLHATTQAGNIEDSMRDGRNAFGERQGHSKFTDVTALEALACYADGWPMQMIADHFDVTFATAQSLCLGETWKHLLRLPKDP